MQSETKVDVWMPLYVSDFLTATLGWSAEERGHYLTLLMAQWANGGLPSDLKALERISPGVSECWAVVGEKFPVGTDGRIRNRRLEEHRDKSVQLRQARQERAKRGAKARWEATEGGDEQCLEQCLEQSSEQCLMNAASSSSSSSPSHTSSAKTTAAPSSQTETPAASGSATKVGKIGWDASQGWTGITAEDRSEWAAAYPGAVLDTELAKATAWLKANPQRCGRRNWRRFIVNWLGRCQDKGGTNRTPGVQPRNFETPEAKAARERKEAERQKSLNEYLAVKERKRAMAIAEGRA